MENKMPFSNPAWPPSKKSVVSPGSGSPFPPANCVLVQHRPYLCKAQPISGLSTDWLLLAPLPTLTSVKWENEMVATWDMGTQLSCSPPPPLHLWQGLGPLLPTTPTLPKWTITLAIHLISWVSGTEAQPCWFSSKQMFPRCRTLAIIPKRF